MVEIRSGEADRFLRRLPPNVFIYLVCGADVGLISERIRHILLQAVDDPSDPFQVVRLGGGDVAADPSKLADEAYTVGLFGGRRAILVSVGAKSILGPIEAVLKTRPVDCTIIIEGGQIKKDAPLRRALARTPDAAVIDCQPDDLRQIERLIDEDVRAAGLSISPSARQFLTTLLGADRLTTRAEIEKLVLFARGKETIEEEDVEAIVADAGTSALDDAIYAAFDGDIAALSAALPRAFLDIGAPALSSFALRHALTLHRLRSEIEAGASAEAVVERSIRAPAKRKASMIQQLRHWRGDALTMRVMDLSNNVRRLRREHWLAEPLMTRALWNVAADARRSRRT